MDDKTQTRLLKLAADTQARGLMTGTESSVPLNGRLVRSANTGDLHAAGEIVLLLSRLARGGDDFHVSHRRAVDLYVLGRTTRETQIEDIAEGIAGGTLTDAFERVLTTLTPIGAARVLLDAAEAKKQAPAKPASPIAVTPLTAADRVGLLDRARKWEDA